MQPGTAISGLAAFFPAQVFAACILGLAATPAAAEEITGIARAIDGDSLRIGAREIRLLGIDAPEYRQTCRIGWTNWACGTDAAAALRTLVDGKRLACLSRARDIYGRTVATCQLGERDVALAMLADGFSVALFGSPPEFVEARHQACTARAGIWASHFDMPADYRAAQPRRETAQTNQHAQPVPPAHRHSHPRRPKRRASPPRCGAVVPRHALRAQRQSAAANRGTIRCSTVMATA